MIHRVWSVGDPVAGGRSATLEELQAAKGSLLLLAGRHGLEHATLLEEAAVEVAGSDEALLAFAAEASNLVGRLVTVVRRGHPVETVHDTT